MLSRTWPASGGLLSVCVALAHAAAAAAPPADPVTADEPASARAAQTMTRRALLGFETPRLRLEAPIELATRYESVSGFRIDRTRTRYESGSVVNPLVRVGLRVDSNRWLAPFQVRAEVEGDFLSGTLVGEPLLLGELPNSDEPEMMMRKANVRVSYGPAMHLAGGLMTSYWGLGLIANDGAHGWEPKSARFSDPRKGDRVWRGMATFAPQLATPLMATVAIDKVYDDDVLQPGDSAVQAIAAVLWGRPRDTAAGLYVVRRHQTTEADRELAVNVIDVTAHTRAALGGFGTLELAGEAAVVFGNTTIAASVEFPRPDVRQIGAVLHAGLDAGSFGGVLDLLYASGDRNPYNGSQTGFKTDRNYEMSLLLYRYLVAAHSGRAPATAGDPALVGYPADGLDRLPTGGAATNSVAVFPRAWWQPVANLEFYGGPLFAFAVVEPIDPLNSRVAGESRNAVDGSPGRYLGTEMDLGLRYGLELWGVEVNAGLEGGVLMPGSAARKASGKNINNVLGGRAMVQVRL